MNSPITTQAHDALALNFIKLEESLRGLPGMKSVFDMATDVLRAANSKRTASGDLVLTTPATDNTTLHATALDRALQAVGVTTHTSRFSNSDVLQDISNNARRDEASLDSLFHKPIYNQVEFTVKAPSVLQGIILK